MKRRTVLWGMLGAAAVGCRPNLTEYLRVKLIARSIPPQVLKAFSRQTPTKFESELSLATIYQQLQQWQQQIPRSRPLWQRLLPLPKSLDPDDQSRGNPPIEAHLVSLGDAWLDHAIEQELIQPLPENALVETLPRDWQPLLRRNSTGKPNAAGKIWAIPYRTQGLVMAYQKPMFNAQIQVPVKWADLWRPELAGRIAMPNHPRLIAAIVLKALGYSINNEAAVGQEDFQEQLLALYRQVKVFDSVAHLKALVNEDVWLAVGWSGDILATLVRYRRLGIAYPKEGTIFTSDLWVAPKQATITPTANTWMDFCWQSPIATQISLSSHGISPAFLVPGAAIPKSLATDPLLQSEYGEVLLPLSKQGESTLTQVFNANAHHE